MAKLDEELLGILVCPQTRAPLVLVGDWLYSTDPQTRRKYPIRDGLPILLIDQSQEADAGEFDEAMAQAKSPEALGGA